MPIINVKNEAEFKQALASAPGSVAVEFVAKDCGYCEKEKPKVDKLAAKCADVTIIRADVDDMPELVDRYLPEDGGTPTIFYADRGTDLSDIAKPEDAEKFELSDSDGLKRKLKCARTPKSARNVKL